MQAVPGAGTNVPLYLLGSSLFGAQLAAALGLPYAFASHFAPEALTRAVAVYREQFEPSEQLDRPHVLAAINVIAAEDDETAADELERVVRARVAMFLGRGRRFDDAELDALVRSPQGRQVAAMMTHTASGAPPDGVGAARRVPPLRGCRRADRRPGLALARRPSPVAGVDRGADQHRSAQHR